MATFDEFYSSLPEESGKRGEFFEKVFVPWFLREDPEWSTKIQKIWLWDEYPDRWGKDCGIDLVYEDQNGKHWAVQSKCISPDREISKAEIDSFLSESNDPRIHGRLLIASTDGIGKNAMQVIERQEKQVVCFLREHFRKSEVEFPSTPLDLATGRRKDKRRPRPHQQEAIRNVVEGLQTQDRGQLLMACGTGKTLTSLWIKEELNAKRTLVLLPSLSLLSQTLREWTATSREEFNWICVCSDKSVAKQDKTVDDWIEHVSEVGVPVTSDPEEIRQFLRNNDERIIFSTYQSCPLVTEAQQDTDIPSFDVVFADEAHRCAGKVSEAFGCVLDSKKIRAQKRLFMTATPRVLSNRIKTKADAEDIEVASMDDESLFGTVLHRLNFSEAISKELLTDYRVVVIGVDDPEVQAQIIHRPLSATSNGVDTDYETLANHISLAKAVRDYDLQRVITFHGRVKGAKKFSEDHPAIVDWLPTSSKTERAIQTEYVSGEMTSLERNNKIGRLRDLEDGEIGILSNARCLSEGVDVPSLDGIAFIDPRSSQVDIIQAVGRAIRKSEEKSFGYIILPVYLGDTENIEEDILASRFKDIWKVILALKSQDDSLSEVLDQLRVELGQRGETTSRSDDFTKIIFDLPQKIENIIGDSFRTLLVRNTTDDWLENYGRIKEFIDREKRYPSRKDDPRLINWLSDQRNKRKRCKLIIYKIRRLEELQDWDWEPIANKQEEWANALEEFLNANGHLSIDTKDKETGVIATMLRNGYAQKSLKQEVINRLNCLQSKGWMWNTNEELFKEKVLLLEEWCISNNSASPPKGTFTNGNLRTYSRKDKSTRVELGEFAIRLRLFYRAQRYPDYKARKSTDGTTSRKARTRRLTGQEIERIERIPGWYWDKFEGYARVYKECIRRGIEITSSTVVDFDFNELRSIGRWVIKARAGALKGELDLHEIKLIESLPNWSYEPVHDAFMRGINEYVQFTRKHPEEKVTQDIVTNSGFRLGGWINRVRQSSRKGELSTNPMYSEFYRNLLTSNQFTWDPRE